MVHSFIDGDKATSFYFGHRVCQVDFNKTVYFFEAPNNPYTGNKALYVSNAPFLYSIQDKSLFAVYDYSVEYDWKHVIGFEDTPEVRKQIPWHNWVNIEDYYHEHKLIDSAKPRKKSDFRLDDYCNRDKEYAVLAGILFIGVLVLVINRRYRGLLYPVAVLIWYVVNEVQIRKKDLRYFLRTVVTDEAFIAKNYRTEVCKVNRHGPVYYKIIQTEEVARFVYSYVLVSNSPFFIGNEKTAISRYDIKKQVLIPYDKRTVEYFDFERWTEV